jgi:hypothetical protein
MTAKCVGISIDPLNIINSVKFRLDGEGRIGFTGIKICMSHLKKPLALTTLPSATTLASDL